MRMEDERLCVVKEHIMNENNSNNDGRKKRAINK